MFCLRERPFHTQEPLDRYEKQAAYLGGHEGTDERCDDADNPAEHTPLVEPCLADPDGQCGSEK